MLRTVLNAHPDLAMPRETRFVLEGFARRREFGDLRVQENRRKFVDWLVESRDSNQFRRLELDERVVRERLGAAPPTIGSVLGTALKMFAEAHGAVRWGDKRPKYIQQLPVIFALFPDAQFISLVRDPRSVIASLRNLGWLEAWHGGSVARAANAWKRSVHEGESASNRYRSDQFLQVRYEDLVDDPVAILKEVCSFTRLSEEHLDAMLSFHESDKGIPEAQRVKFHPMIDQPFTKSDPRGWAPHLTEQEAAFIERALGREMERFQYEPSSPRVNPPVELEREWATLQRRRLRSAWRGIRSATYPHAIAARVTTAQVRRARLIGFGRGV